MEEEGGDAAIDAGDMFWRRWRGFIASMWLMQFCGSYSFPNYSNSLKQAMALDQAQLNLLSVAKDIGDSGGVLAGFLSDLLSPAALLCIGAVVAFFGYGFQWLVVVGIAPASLPFWMVFTAALLSGNSISWINTAVFTTSVRNFPRNRGPVLGLLKAYMGLSAAIFSFICDMLLSSSESGYLLTAVILPPSFSVVAAFFLSSVPPSESVEDKVQEKMSLLSFNVIALVMAVYIAIINFFASPQSKGQNQQKLGIVCIFLAMALSPMAVPLWVRYRSSRKLDKMVIGWGKEDRQSLLRKTSDTDDDDAMESAPNSPVLAEARRLGGEDRKTSELFRRWDFYALYFTLLCGAGSGMAFSNNLGQIGRSLGFSTVTGLSSFFSLGNFMGRIASGNISEHFLRVAGIPRPGWLMLVKLPMILIYLWVAMGSQRALQIGSFALGFCQGSNISLTLPIISEFYGLRHYGSNASVINTHILAGSSLFSGVIAGYLYDLEAKKQQGTESSDGASSCSGSSCYGLTMIILSGFLGVASVADAILTATSRPLYKKLQIFNTQHLL